MKETVEQVKADLVARGVDLSGPCGAFAIAKRVAWALKESGAGLLSKPSGNNCDGYATDVICYPDGRTFDILIDGGGQNGPTWEQHHPHDPSVAARYRPAIDPGDVKPEPKPEPKPVDLSALLAQLQRMNDQLDTAARASTDAKVAAQLALDVARETQAAAAATLTVVQDVATRPDPPQPIAWAGALGLRVRLTPEYPAK